MTKIFARIVTVVGVYGVVSFVIGFSLMAFELVASRILAPTVGSSMYVWTSVIGVIIAALSLGYAVGGWVADKRVAKTDIAWLLIGAAVTATLTLLTYEDTLRQISMLAVDDRLRAVYAALHLFLATSFLLGMISPYLVRLQNESLATTGRTAASLSAFNAVGGILGTFCVGFIFFGYIGTRQTLMVVIVLLLAASWLVAPAVNIKKRALACLVVAAVLGLTVAMPRNTTALRLDTPTMQYQVVDGTDNRGEAARYLLTGPYAAQSGVYLDGSSRLMFGYTQKMADIIAAAPHHDSILVLGGGAFTLPRYLGETYPNAHIDVVEIDARLPDIAKRFFNYYDQPNVTVINKDARTFLVNNTRQYDVVLVDVYGEASIPFSMTTVEYVRSLQRSVAPQGVVAVNVIGSLVPACASILAGLHAGYSSVFSHYAAFAITEPQLQAFQNVIIAYSTADLQWLQPLQPLDYPLPTDQQFTDNFAPIERLHQECRAAVYHA